MTGEGYQVDIAELRRTYPEVGWHDFNAWCAEQDWPRLLALVSAASQPEPTQASMKE